MEKVMVTASVATVFESRKRGALLADELLCGMEAELLERYSDGFCRIRSFYGYEGYVKAPCLVAVEEGTGAREGLPRLMVTGSYVNVQQSPAVRSVALLSLPRGSYLWGEGPSMEGWQPVLLAGGQRGFLPAVHLTPYPLGAGLTGVELRRSLCNNALSYMGSCYRWGGKTPLGLDCSGLCSQVYLNHGIFLYRDAAIVAGYAVEEVAVDALQPADLLYFKGHMALYLGEGRYIHSAASAGGVTVSSLTPGGVDYREDLAKGLLRCGSAAG